MWKSKRICTLEGVYFLVLPSRTGEGTPGPRQVVAPSDGQVSQLRGSQASAQLTAKPGGISTFLKRDWEERKLQENGEPTKQVERKK